MSIHNFQPTPLDPSLQQSHTQRVVESHLAERRLDQRIAAAEKHPERISIEDWEVPASSVVDFLRGSANVH